MTFGDPFEDSGVAGKASRWMFRVGTGAASERPLEASNLRMFRVAC